MNDLVTLERRHPTFLSYLRGTFARDRRALPLRSLNVRTPSETVTFRIVELARIARPPWPVVWLKALRVRTFLQVLVPVLFVAGLQSLPSLDPDLPWLATAGVLLLHASLLLRNDVQDHFTGFDRIRSDRGSRAIQNGWLTAAQLETASWVLLAGAVLAGLPVIFARPAVSAVVLAAAAAGGFAFFRRDTSFRDQRSGLVSLFLLSGPLLFSGLSLAFLGALDPRALAAGAVWGWLLIFPVHLRDFEHLIVEGQSGRGSLVGRLGFDRALVVLQTWWFLTLCGFGGFWFWIGGPTLLWVFFLAVVFISMGFSRRLRRLKSPAGSEVALIRKSGEILTLTVILMWILGSMWRMTL